MPSAGALTQLAAKGPQDKWLTAEAVVTHFKGGYRRHTNFAMAEMEGQFNGANTAGSKHTGTIQRNGDLMAQVYFAFDIAALNYTTVGATYNPPIDQSYWVNSVGHAILDTIETNIGGHCFDKHYGEYLEIWEDLASAPEKRMTEQVGFSTTTAGLVDYARQQQRIYTPLQFWYNRFYEQAFPLIANQYHEVRIDIQSRAETALFVRLGLNATEITDAEIPAISNIRLLINYVFLDTMERRMFAQQAHEYVFDELQFSNETSVTAGTTSVDQTLTFNHPVKELIWVYQLDSVRDLSGTPASFDYFDYAGAVDANGLPTDNPSTTQLFLNGHERTLAHPPIYYRSVQPRQHHSRIPSRYIYSYSFALYPEDSKPSGSVNLSRIDNVVLRHTFAAGLAAMKIRTYARNINVMKTVSGMSGKMYSS